MVKWSRGGEKAALKKGPWTPEEDQKLMVYIQQHGHGSWSSLPAKVGLKRCGKSCRLRWNNYLRPDIKRGKFSLQEDQTIIQLHALLGNRWSAIALHLPKRTDNEIKNHWNTHLKKRLTRMGIDPSTHKPLNDAVHAHAANLNHMAQWETARLQAETRLVRESKLRLHINQLSSFSSQPSPTPCLDVLKAWQNSWSSSTLSTPMHSMYATMLATHDDLKSPTSTLCFPDTIFLNSNSITDSNMSASGLINESLLLSSTCVNATGENSSVGSLRDDDDIMVVVEAFRSTGYYNNCNNFMEGVHNEDVLAYGFNENSSAQQNLGVFNDGEAGSTNFEDKHYWETILNLVNDFP